MKNFKLLGALALVLALTLTGCGSKDTEETKEEGAKETETEQVATNDDAEEANNDVEEPAGEEEAQDVEEDGAGEEDSVSELISTDVLKFDVDESEEYLEEGEFGGESYRLKYYTPSSQKDVAIYFNDQFPEDDFDPEKINEYDNYKKLYLKNADGDTISILIHFFYNERTGKTIVDISALLE